MSKLSRENTALKMKGAGDGIKHLTRSSERIPVPSSRKFTATMVRDESVQTKLKKVLDDLEAKQKLKKSKTVAEITPTKSNRKKPKRQDGGASSASHATPRPPPVDAVKKPPSGLGLGDVGDDERRRRLELLVYQRMLLFVWRRGKKRLAMLSESLRRRQDQISNLEKQVNCLKNLTQSECHKRGEAMGDRQRMENILKSVEMENKALIEEKVVLQNEVNELRNKLQIMGIEIENMKNEIHTKNSYVKRLENDVLKEKMVVKQIRAENDVFVNKVKAQDLELQSKEEVTAKLNQALKDLENRLKECDREKKANAAELNKSAEQYRLKVRSYDCLRQELGRIHSQKDEMRVKLEILEDQLTKMSHDYDDIFKENEFLKRKIREKKCWWANARELAVVSWAVLQNAAYLMLPAL